jgi:hypothetical protein
MGIGGLSGKPSEPLWGGAISQSGIKLSLKTQKEQDKFFKHQPFPKEQRKANNPIYPVNPVGQETPLYDSHSEIMH